MGYVIFQKHLRKLSLGRVPKQTCSQSAVRGKNGDPCKYQISFPALEKTLGVEGVRSDAEVALFLLDM